MIDVSAKRELLALLEARALYHARNKWERFYPETGKFARSEYRKHMECFALGATVKARCVQGGNGIGKTESLGAYETMLHATGKYPEWWPGFRFNHPTDIWVSGDTKETVRDITQAKLIGDVAKRGISALGNGILPYDTIMDGGEFTGKFRQGSNYSCDFVRVRHVSGGYSVIAFKSYDQRRENFQGTEKHFIWLDEEPPWDIYGECVMRGRTVGGKILLTFTPLSGPTEVVQMFEKANKEGDGSMVLVKIGWDDVPHLTDEEKRDMLAGQPKWLWPARMNGDAVAGTGRIYPVDEKDFVVKPFPIPPHYRRVFGIDCGWHKTAVVWGAYDKDNDIVYAYSEHYRGEAEVPVHAKAIHARGVWIPGVGDVAGASQTNGERFIDLYKANGVRIDLPDKGVDGGIATVLERLSTGRLKIFNTCENLIAEMRRYSYDKDGKVVKVDDHACDALRYLIVSGLDKAALPRRDPLPVMQEQTFGVYQ